jgi:ribosomal protein S18
MESQSFGGPGRGAAARRPFFRRRKSCPFSGPNAPKIDYKDVKLLQRFISERGKRSRPSGSASWPRRSSGRGFWVCSRIW